MGCEQLDFDQYIESLATEWFLEQEAARKRWEAEPRESTPDSRILEEFGYSTVYSEADFFSNVNKESGNVYRGMPCWEWIGKRTRDWGSG